MTPGIRVHVVMPPGLLERVDAARGEGQSRGDFVRRAVERALDERVPASAVDTTPPAPAEQPEMDGVPFADPSDRLRETRRVSPSGPASPRVPFRRDVKPFQRGGS